MLSYYTGQTDMQKINRKAECVKCGEVTPRCGSHTEHGFRRTWLVEIEYCPYVARLYANGEHAQIELNPADGESRGQTTKVM